MNIVEKQFSQGEVEAIAAALGDTSEGLTGSEIGHILAILKMAEQSGFANLVKGVFGMFRNPAAHEARILWCMSKDDAEDLLSIASLIQRRIESAR